MWSDDAWVEGRFAINTLTAQKPCWRFNQNLLYLELIDSDLEDELRNYFALNNNCGVWPHMVWDAMKVVIRGKIIAITSAYDKQKKYKEESLQKISNLEAQHKRTYNSKVFKALQVEHKKLKAMEVSAIGKKYFVSQPKILASIS